MKNATLSYYFQEEAVAAVLGCKKKGNFLVVAPTGSGKTHILSKLIKALPTNEKVLVLTHVKEIIQQNHKTLIQYVEESKVGIWSAGIGKKEKRQYTIAGIQSIYAHSKYFSDYKWIIIDEAHLIPTSGTGRYKTFLAGMTGSKIVGLTATPFRLGQGYLTDGDIFDAVIFEIDIMRLVKEGYLSKLLPKSSEYVMDLKNVRTICGDFSKKDLSKNLDGEKVTSSIVNELIKYKNVRNKWLIFAINIEHAENIAKQLIKKGISCAAVHSKMSAERKQTLEDFKKGHLQALVSVEILTTGFDEPSVDMIAILRPTKSPVLHVQMIGRGLRTAKGKTDCLVLDFAGNIERLGAINDVVVETLAKGKNKGSGNAPAKTCPKCSTRVRIAIMTCPNCNYVFRIKEKLSTKSGKRDIIANKYDVKILTVRSVLYSVHKSRKSFKSSLKVTYTSGFLCYHEWHCFDHKGFARHKAVAWWCARSNSKAPKTVSKAFALTHILKKPKQIGVINSGRFPEIVRHIF